MSIEKVREYFRGSGMEDRIREFPVSSATVELAARAVGVEPGRIAKSMSFKLGEEAIVVVMAGDARVDNARYKARFHAKAKMLRFDEAHTLIGHDPGGVCSSFRMASILVKGLSAPQARSQRPMRLMTRISAAPRSKSPTPRPGARPV